ncbi:DUF5994 family protein [Streptomyces sp. NPDC101209]|uniref:DUF5994 family protein n=1 Tax=Streptomyces sp. NPDC101209 TaxID=3366129 RepID=UPI00382B8BBF
MPSLVALLVSEWGTTARVTVGVSRWPHAPRSVMAPGRLITVEPTDSDHDAGLITNGLRDRGTSCDRLNSPAGPPR